jgi:phosphoglycerol geranylgeranyltransferase
MTATILDGRAMANEIRVEIAERVGSTAIMVGGSTISDSKVVDETVKEIKSSSSLPVILYPSSANFLSKHADAIFFMSLLNSRNPRYIIGEQAEGAMVVKKLGIEPIPMGYIVVEPGM